MALVTHDLALALAELEAPNSAPLTLFLPGFLASLVRIEPGSSFERSVLGASTLLVLQGLGSIAVDDWRATLAGGHLLAVPAQARLQITADGGAALCVLLTQSSAGKVEASEPSPP